MREEPTDYRLLTVNEAVTWNDLVDIAGSGLLFGWGFGAIIMVGIWALHLPIFFLTGWGAGPNEVTFDLFSKYWIWIVIYFSFCTSMAGGHAGTKKYRQMIDVDLLERKFQFWEEQNRAEHPEEYDS
jgi:hypothetical protein